MISDGAIRVWELHFVGPVPDEGGCPTELEGKWGVDGTWIDPKLLSDGRIEEMGYMRKMEVFDVVDEKECYDNVCKPLELKWVDKMKGDNCRSRLVCREIKRVKDRHEQLGPEDVFSPVPPSEGLKMLLDTTMETTQTVRLRWQRGMYRERTSTVKLAGGFTRIFLKDMSRRASWPQERVWNARRSVNLGRHVVRSVE